MWPIVREIIYLEEKFYALEYMRERESEVSV
jgi:hypothetical protein